MNLKTSSLVLLCCLLPSLQALAVTRNVPGDFSTIQAAINASSAGDDVEVAAGTYRENLTLSTAVDVRGAEAARTVLIARDASLPVVTGTNVRDLLFANFTISDSDIGVSLFGSINITLASIVFDSLDATAVLFGALSSGEIINNVFYRNNIAIDRLSVGASVTNNIFAENNLTIVSTLDINPIDPGFAVDFNCFYRNDDLVLGGVDTALGDNFQIGNPEFVAPGEQDFHLQQTSVCIDAGSGEDVIDVTVADMGAYGGEFADARPFPVAQPTPVDASASDPAAFNIELDWSANLAYLVTSDILPGAYRVWYQLNRSGPPYEGADAGGGTEPSPVDVGNVTSYTLTDLNPQAQTPGVPVLVSASPQNQSAVLSWNAAANATEYRVYYGSAAVTENMIDVGNVTGFTVNGLTNGTAYTFAVSAGIQPVYYLSVTAIDSTVNQNESVFSTEASIAIGEPIESMLSNTLTVVPEEVIPYPDLPDEGCFIATAAFGADWAAEVQVLRDFRDRFLLTNAPGRALVAWYYREGPMAAAYLNQNDGFKPLVRGLLWPLVAMAAFLLLLLELLLVLTRWRRFP